MISRIFSGGGDAGGVAGAGPGGGRGGADRRCATVEKNMVAMYPSPLDSAREASSNISGSYGSTEREENDEDAEDLSSDDLFGGMFDISSHDEPVPAQSADGQEYPVLLNSQHPDNSADTDIDMTIGEEMYSQDCPTTQLGLQQQFCMLHREFTEFRRVAAYKLQALEEKLDIANDTIVSLNRDIKKLQSTNPAKYKAMDENIKLKAGQKSQRDAENKLRAENAQLRKQVQQGRTSNLPPSDAHSAPSASSGAQHHQPAGVGTQTSTTSNPAPSALSTPSQNITFPPATAAAGMVHISEATDMEWEYTG